MSKFRQGLKFRHINALDTDMLVISQDNQNFDSVTLTVMFLAQSNSRPIAKDQVVIREQDFDNWKQVIGGNK